MLWLGIGNSSKSNSLNVAAYLFTTRFSTSLSNNGVQSQREVPLGEKTLNQGQFSPHGTLLDSTWLSLMKYCSHLVVENENSTSESFQGQF